MIINIDLDGVIYDFHKEFTDYVSIKKDPTFQWRLPEPTTWEFWREWNMSHGEWKGWFRRAIEDKTIWWKGTPIGAASKVMWHLSDAGHTLRIVTYRLVHKFNHATSIQATVSWLDEHNIPYHDICFLSHRTKKDHIRADVALDDNPAYLPTQLDPRDPIGYLYKRTWNQESWKAYETVEDWWDFYEKVETLAAG
jgi:5'(3')-deoxyribonucleotidase